MLLASFVSNQGLELVVQNLSRLNEESEEDAQGVFNTLAIVENLVDLKSSIAVDICAKTHLLKFLLMRLRVRKFDTNKLYCSEILSILLQADPINPRQVNRLTCSEIRTVLLRSI